MSDINKLEKKIYVNKPSIDSNAQYNFGRVLEGDSIRVLGKKRSGTNNVDSDIYTLVYNQENKNLTEYPDGILGGVGSEITIDYAQIKEDNAESDGGRYVGVKVAFYVYDGDTVIGKAIANAKKGNKIRTAIGTGNGFDDTDNRVRYWNKGSQDQDTPMGDVISGDGATYGGQPNPQTWDDISNASDFPNESTSTIPFNNIKRWTEYLTNTHEDDESNQSYIWIVGRVSGDERETIWPFGTKTDERDRTYVKLRIPKSELYDIWKNKNGETLLYDRSYSTSDINDNDQRDDLGKYAGRNYRDNYGNHNGHGGLTDNWDPVNFFTSMSISIKAPTFSPLNSIKSIEDGGMNACWVDKNTDGYHCIKTADEQGNRVGLNPKYDMDFTGFPDKFYVESDSEGKSKISRNYFSSSMVPDFRPISFVSSSFDTDLQGHYDGDTKQHQQLRVQASVPATVTLKFKLAKKYSDFEPEYIDLTNDIPYNDFNYHFFVVNWDFKEGDQETLDQIADMSFPVNGDEYQSLVKDGLFELKDIKNGDNISYSNYQEPGIKIIKAVVLRTIDNNWSGNNNWSDYVQAVDWKLTTIKINLTNEGSQITSDFGDVGGDDFTYLPYPDVVNLSRADNGGETWPASNEDGPGPPSNPENGAYKSSHPVISGLSDESVYINALKKINQVQPFGSSEIDERNKFDRAKSLSLIGDMNEWGDYLGQSDISQIRFFNKPYDMREMLDIQTVYGDETTFNNYTDIYDEIDNPDGYWDNPLTNKNFPKEKVVGSIFISEYDQFKESCLVELNCGTLDGKTIKDTSGSGNKGILLGDYSVKKTKPGKLTTRDSYVKTPKTDSKNGAF